MAATGKKRQLNPKHGKPRLSVQFYEALVEAYRNNPSNHAGAAKAVGCARKTAKRGWDEGWSKYEWAPPIKDVIAQEAILARARIQQEWEAEEEQIELRAEGKPADTISAERKAAHLDAQADRAKAKEQAIAARAAEGKMVDAIRRVVSAGAGGLLRQGEGINALAERVNSELLLLSKAKVGSGQKDFRLGPALSTLRKYATAGRDLSQAAQNAVELERLHLGEPGKIVGVQLEGAFDNAPMDDVLREIQKAADAIKDAEDKGITVDGRSDEVVH